MPISEQIKSLPYREEKTLIVCNQLEEAEQLADHLKSNDVTVELVKNIHSDCKGFVLFRPFHDEISKSIIFLNCFRFCIQMPKTKSTHFGIKWKVYWFATMNNSMKLASKMPSMFSTTPFRRKIFALFYSGYPQCWTTIEVVTNPKQM